MVKCTECYKTYYVTANYYTKLELSNHRCKQCKLKGLGNPNFEKNWGKEKKEKHSILIKSKVDDDYRKKCSKGMKGKKVSNETKEKKRNTMLEKYGKLSNIHPMTLQTKKLIGEKSKLKFNEEYLKRIRKINEEKGIWIPFEKKDEYKIYRDLSNWKSQVLNENTFGIEKLKNGGLYNKKNRNKNSFVRDHMYGRKNGYMNGVFPEIIRHPANCQIISHSDNIKKSKKNNDSIISLNELFEKIKNWENYYEEQKVCLTFVKNYELGMRFDLKDYVTKIYK
jgi:hypothetical protein